MSLLKSAVQIMTQQGGVFSASIHGNRRFRDLCCFVKVPQGTLLVDMTSEWRFLWLMGPTNQGEQVVACVVAWIDLPHAPQNAKSTLRREEATPSANRFFSKATSNLQMVNPSIRSDSRVYVKARGYQKYHLEGRMYVLKKLISLAFAHPRSTCIVKRD